MARVIFAKGRGRVSVWLDEAELASMLAEAFERGMECGRQRTLDAVTLPGTAPAVRTGAVVRALLEEEGRA